MKNYKKLLLSLVLGACLMDCPTAEAQRLAVSSQVVEDSVKQMEIMVGDKYGDLRLENTVTRAEFATMLVSASSYKNVTTHFGYTLFPDVPSSHWASGYVKVVVEHGYMVGQVNGYFSPDRPVVLEEAVTATLALLGYDSNSLSGTYPEAQLAKYYSLEMDEYMTAKTGEALTREDCMYLFFNLMNTPTIEGTAYAQKMGFATTADGSLDTIALTNSLTQGPFLVGTSVIPSSVNNVDIIYKNDKLSSAKEMSNFDICYYNEKLSTVWIYDEKITGRLTNIDSLYSPSVVTVSGVGYTLETTNVKYKFSVGGEFEEGDFVTLLMGQYGQVADVVSANITDSTVVGVVLEEGIDQIASGNNESQLGRYVKIITTNGDILEVDSEGLYKAGRLVEVNFKSGVQSVKAVTDKTLEGQVNSTATKIGKLTLAEDVKIIEISGDNYTTLYPSRLAGSYIEEEDVRYYTTNSKGEIDQLMLEDVTGDAAQFVYISTTNTLPTGMIDVVTYNYYYQGQFNSYTSQTITLNGKTGGAYFEYDDMGRVEKLVNLTPVTLTSLNVLQGSVNGKVYDFDENIQVLERYRNTYQGVTLSDVSDLDKYTLTAYYDADIFSAGGQIRILVAELKD